MEVVPGVVRFRDTCNVYVLRSGREATLVDFGTGYVLDHLRELGVDRVTDVLVTHHHRDQVQGLARAAAAGVRIWVPPVERELIAKVDEHWQRRPLENDYDVLEDRFSLREPVAVTGTVDEYRTRRHGAFEVYTLPTPGHTVGSVTYLVSVEGRRLAFTGDLLYGPGKVWSVAATQWSYTGVEGQRASYLSLGILGENAPDLLLPSHGEPIADPQPAIELTQRRLDELMNMRSLEGWDLDMRLRAPWAELTPHLLRNRTSFAIGYALLSDSGAALLIDFGYDLWPGHPLSGERYARRPLLNSIRALRRDHGIERVEAVVMTHFHDDHVAGINLLRDVEGTEVWAPENVAPILANPARYDLPCLWYDPIPVDRVLPLERPIAWREHELTAYPLPGHTLFQAAIGFDVDGTRVVAIGDQQSSEGDGSTVLNYQYRNRFRIGDYVRSAELYLSLRPDLFLSGHWNPREVTEEHLERLLVDARRLDELHRELLPLEEIDFGAQGFGARIEPYRARVAAGDTVELEITVRNPFDRAEVAVVRCVVPEGWSADPVEHEIEVGGRSEASIGVRVTANGPSVCRARVAVDLTVGESRFGEQAEALVTVE